MTQGKVNSYTELSPIQQEVLTGSLLGDGHLSLPGYSKNALYRVCRSQTDQEYLRYEASIWNNLLTPTYRKGIKCYSKIDSRTDKLYLGCVFATESNPVFTTYHHKWYRFIEEESKFVKIVPTDTKLSSLVVAHWFADDGRIVCPNLPYRFTIRFSTDGFTKDEVCFLADLLRDRYNEEFAVYKKEKNHIIYAADSASRSIIQDIDPVFKMVRKRLWDNQASRYYSDAPDRQLSGHKIHLDRKVSIKEILDSVSETITVVNLAKQLDCWVTSKNEPNYQLINKLLKPYEDTNYVRREKIGNSIILRINKQVDS